MATNSEENNTAFSGKSKTTSSRSGFPVTIIILALLSIAAIWYYAINRHFHLQSNKSRNLAQAFARDFAVFYDGLAHAADVFAEENAEYLLAAMADNPPASERTGNIDASLNIMSILSAAEMAVVSDNSGRPLFASHNWNTSFPPNQSLLGAGRRDAGMSPGVHFLGDADTGEHYLVITTRPILSEDAHPVAWPSFVFRVDEIMKRAGGIEDKISLIDRSGDILFAGTDLPDNDLFRDRMAAGIWKTGVGARPGASPVVQYDSRLEFGYAPLPGGRIAAISPMSGVIDDYLLFGALLTVFVAGTIPYMLRIHASRERARMEEQRLRYYVAEIEKAKLDAERANMSKSEFLATISHEIRNLMNGVIGMLDLLSRTRLSEKQHEYCDIIKTSTNSLLGILNDILDFTKIEAGKMGIEEAPFDLQATAAECLRLLSSRAEERGNELVFDYDPGIPTHVIGDMIRLRQIISNLVSNAIKFTSDGTVGVAVTGTPGEGGRTLYAIRVTDTGVGIEPEKQARIFEKFEQADPSITRKYGGSGLGLAICKRLTNLMGGEITCESEVDRGSTFTITMPLLRGMRGASPLQSAMRRTWKGTPAIVLEPNAGLREVLDRMVGSLGFAVKTTGSPEDAIELTRRLARTPEIKHPLILVANADPDETMSLIHAFRKAAGNTEARIFVASYPSAAEELPRPEPGRTYDMLLIKPLWRTQLFQTIEQSYHELRQESPPLSHETASGDSAAVGGSDATVLLAEDNIVNQKVGIGLLKKFGFDVDVANNGLEAVHMALDKHYDVILMDCQMPEMDGFEATRRIRRFEETEGDKRSVIIALTANAMAEDRENCISAGMDSHVPKPIDPAQLMKTIRQFLPSQPQQTKS